jgi:hypothetical protein
MAGCRGNPRTWYTFILAKKAAPFTPYCGRAVRAEERRRLAASATEIGRTCWATAYRLRLSNLNAAKNRITEQKSEHTPAEYSRQFHAGPPRQAKLHNANFQIHAIVSAFPAHVTYVQTLRLNFVEIEAKSRQIRRVRNVDNEK